MDEATGMSGEQARFLREEGRRFNTYFVEQSLAL